MPLQWLLRVSLAMYPADFQSAVVEPGKSVSAQGVLRWEKQKRNSLPQQGIKIQFRFRFQGLYFHLHNFHSKNTYHLNFQYPETQAKRPSPQHFDHRHRSFCASPSPAPAPLLRQHLSYASIHSLCPSAPQRQPVDPSRPCGRSLFKKQPPQRPLL